MHLINLHLTEVDVDPQTFYQFLFRIQLWKMMILPFLRLDQDASLMLVFQFHLKIGIISFLYRHPCFLILLVKKVTFHCF